MGVKSLIRDGVMIWIGIKLILLGVSHSIPSIIGYGGIIILFVTWFFLSKIGIIPF